MPRFAFSLDPLLALRRREERDAQEAVAKVERERVGLEDDLRRQQQGLESARAVLRSSLTGTLDAQHLRMYANTAVQQMRRAQRLLPELAAVHRRLETARETLVEAARRRRALEQLRERRHAEWRQEQERLETATLDDIAGSRGERTP